MANSCSVVIASTNRPEILKEIIFSLRNQTLLPKEVIVSVVKLEDYPQELNDLSFPFEMRCVISAKGLAKQRNYGFESLLSRTDFVCFFDDDLILHEEYLRKMASTFAENESCVCCMGHLLANGDITIGEAKELCLSPPDIGENKDKYYATSAEWGQLYGCNMCFRWGFLLKEKFDERLPLYSEMEDVDMGTRARRVGDVGYYFGSLAVHLKVSSGRINNRMHGFSQIMNAFYLAKKGSIPMRYTILQIVLRKPIQNFILIFVPKQTSKRVKLLYGNFYALINILLGNIDPELLLKLK